MRLNLSISKKVDFFLGLSENRFRTVQVKLEKSIFLLKIFLILLFVFGVDPDRIELLGKSPAEQHSLPSKSRTCYPTFPSRKCRSEVIRV